jgi:hypothetical protein
VKSSGSIPTNAGLSLAVGGFVGLGLLGLGLRAHRNSSTLPTS